MWAAGFEGAVVRDESTGGTGLAGVGLALGADGFATGFTEVVLNGLGDLAGVKGCAGTGAGTAGAIEGAWTEATTGVTMGVGIA